MKRLQHLAIDRKRKGIVMMTSGLALMLVGQSIIT